MKLCKDQEWEQTGTAQQGVLPPSWRFGADG